MTYDTAKALARELQNSEEYAAYRDAKERAMENETTRQLIAEYHKLQIRAQASAVSGEKNDALLQQLQKVGEVLQFNPDASQFLLAEYRLNRVLADVYKILADAVQIDLGALEG